MSRDGALDVPLVGPYAHAWYMVYECKYLTCQPRLGKLEWEMTDSEGHDLNARVGSACRKEDTISSLIQRTLLVYEFFTVSHLPTSASLLRLIWAWTYKIIHSSGTCKTTSVVVEQ